MKLYVGTSGYSYKEWKGTFYPDKLPASEMLSYYAERLPAVEINSTFYRLPQENVLEAWAGCVPQEFRFSIKASRRITHIKRLKDVPADTSYFFDTVLRLGDRLGATLFQLPPNFAKDTTRLEGFLDSCPDQARVAVEFRNASWFDKEIEDILRSHDATLCMSDTDEMPVQKITRTSSWGYLRLRRAEYSEAALKQWIKKVRSTGWDEAFIFFKHEDEGVGPRLAADFIRLAEHAVSA